MSAAPEVVGQRHESYEHLALVHDGPAALAAQLAPIVDGAVSRGDAVLLCVDELAADHLRERIARPDGVTFVHAASRYATPGAAIHSLQRFLDGAFADGFAAAWSIGSVPYDLSPFDRRWLRYESDSNHVLGHLPLHAICAYDSSVLPAALIHAAHMAHDAVHGTTPPFAEPPLASPLAPDAPPLIACEVTKTSTLRKALTTALGDHLGRERLDDVLLATTEIATNALLHGRPPVTANVWADSHGAVVEITDHGPPLGDPYAHLRPLDGGADGGYGLWLVGELADDVTIDRTDDMNVVRAHFADRSAPRAARGS